MKKLLNNLKCKFGIHNWINIDNHQRILEHGIRYLQQDLHECSRCKKIEYKGMGWIG